jgi:hypothetical protein
MYAKAADICDCDRHIECYTVHDGMTYTTPLQEDALSRDRIHLERALLMHGPLMPKF